MTDEKLIELYMLGFEHELEGEEDIKFYLGDHPLKSPAYKLGKLHAAVGDDCRSVDYLSREEIIKMIRS